PDKIHNILENTHSLAYVSYKHLTDKMMSRCLYLLETPVKERLNILPQLLYSFDPMYNVFAIQTIAADKFVQEDIKLPEFEW
uniref:hypothetical protein n=1 Tax=Providencia sp. TaxID=589 RepID=UPI00333EB964